MAFHRLLIYDATDDSSVEKFVKAVQDLPSDKKWRFEITEVKPIRSLGQNRRYWALINQVAIQSGHTRDEIDFMFRMARHYEMVYYPNGSAERMPKKTSNLDTREFTAMMNNLEQWCQECFPEVTFTKDQDMTLERWMEIDSEYEKTQSGL